MDDEAKLKETFSNRFRWLWDVDIEGQADRAKKIMLNLMKEEAV